MPAAEPGPRVHTRGGSRALGTPADGTATPRTAGQRGRAGGAAPSTSEDGHCPETPGPKWAPRPGSGGRTRGRAEAALGEAEERPKAARPVLTHAQLHHVRVVGPHDNEGDEQHRHPAHGALAAAPERTGRHVPRAAVAPTGPGWRGAPGPRRRRLRWLLGRSRRLGARLGAPPPPPPRPLPAPRRARPRPAPHCVRARRRGVVCRAGGGRGGATSAEVSGRRSSHLPAASWAGAGAGMLAAAGRPPSRLRPQGPRVRLDSGPPRFEVICLYFKRKS